MPDVADTTYLSPAAHARLTAELEELTTLGRTEIAGKIQVAREMGDLKENGDYHAAKEEQGKMEGRIRHLAATLENSEIIEVTDAGVAAAGTIVSVDFGDDDIERYLIGSIEEVRDGVEVISPASPLGEALLGHAVGDEVQYETPGGMLKVTITEIEI